MHPNRIGWMTILLAAAAVTTGHSFSIDGTAPTVHFNGITNAKFPQFQAEFESKMNAEVKTAFDNTIATANTNLQGFREQKDLAQGMANANSYSSNSATLQGFQNYDLFAVSAGLMIAVQAPSLSTSYYKSIGADITQKGDLYAGLGAGFTYLNVGINCSKFLKDGLYLNAKYGGLNLDLGDFSMDFKVMGLGASYRFMAPKSFAGLVKWRGVSFSTGFYVQMDKLNMKVTPDTVKTDAKFREAMLAGSTGQDSTDKEAILTEMGYGPGSKDAQVLLSPEFNMGLDVSTYTVPLEANTAVALLFGIVNVNAGLGLDLNFGSAKVVLDGNSDANIKGNSDKVTFDKATVHIDGSSDNGPSFARLRAMTGVGVGLGPVKIDVPLIYYFTSGLAFGITAAVVW